MKNAISNVIDKFNNKFNSVMTADDAHAYVQQVIEKATAEFIDQHIKPACEKCKFSVDVPLEETDTDSLNKRHEIEIRLTAYGYELLKSVMDKSDNPVTTVSWGVKSEEKEKSEDE